MKLRKPLSLLLSALMVAGSASFAASAASAPEAVGYNNQTYLETQASSAYNEKNLGATYSKTSTTWKTWSPDASSVKVKLYATGSDGESGARVIGEHAMTKNATTGVWSLTLQGDYKNVYYTYIVNVKGKTNETQDVYSKATGVNGNRSMVVDLASTNPEGWSDDKHVLFNGAQEAVVWEIHVRDFSVSKNSGVSDDNKGKYLGFTEGGTKLNGSGSVSTCVDYLVEQGINCVQIMPAYDFQSVDETKGGSGNRNWGYDPQNYNVPEGSYSSNPYDGNVRIKEFKQMVQALHDRGISVVMDVVYNHTYASDGSCFSKTVPGYYYRMSGSNTYSNGSGCGNETASDKKMFRKYMIESVKYWAEEYHIDGFRFDLMGLHDVTTMNEIRSAVDGITANMSSGKSGRQILLYGEAWTGGTTANPDAIYSWQGTGLSRLDSRVGAFGDRYRDALRGENTLSSKGFIQGNTTANTGNVVLGVQGKPYKATNPKSPAQAISYADCHDNYILWDKLSGSNGITNYTNTDSRIVAQTKMTMALLLTSQGIPFMTAGSEFGRSKKGDENSYNKPDNINEIDWSRTSTLSTLTNYYKGLLQIRKNYNPLKGSSFSNPTFTSNYGDVVGYTYSNSASGQWNKLAVLVNASASSTHSINIGGSGWTVVANNNSAGVKSLGTAGSSYSIGPRSVAILVDTASFNNLKLNESFGTLTVKHVDQSGKVLKQSSAKYRAGSTYRAMPDTTILYDNRLIKTEGTTTGTVAANGSYNVTYTYSSTGVSSGMLTVKYVDQSGKEIKESNSTKMREGDTFSVPFTSIQGYQLDTDKYPANTQGTFSGKDTTITFTYKPLTNTSTIVHYYNSNNWSNVICYAYNDAGEISGTWQTAPVMSNEGSGWLKATVPASNALVIFHPKSGTGQEPAQLEPGYPVSGEAWIQNKVVTYNTTIVTSHVDLNTGKKISSDVVENKTKVKSTDTYTTKPLSGRTDVVTPANASGTMAPGVVNVVYLYGKADTPTQPTQATQPTQVTQPTQATDKPTEATQVTQPTKPAVRVLIGDANQDGKILIGDATAVQRHIGKIKELSELGVIAADCNGDGIVSIKDATLIQKFLAGYTDTELVGRYSDDTSPVTEPDTEPTDPSAEPDTEPSTESGPKSFYFSDALAWGDIHVYAWDESGTALTAEWPGDAGVEGEMNPYGQMVYTINVPEGAAGVIVNGNGNQTANITNFDVEGYYVSADQTDTNEFGSTVYVPIPWEPIPPTDPTGSTGETHPSGSFQFSDSLHWGDIHVYAWGPDGDLTAAWPGDPAAEGTPNDYGEMVYTVNVPEGAIGVIVNGGGKQTANITSFDVEGYYVSESQTEIDENGTTVYTPIPWGPPPTDPAGTFKFSDSLGWGGIHVYAYNDGGDVGAAWPGTEISSTETNDYGQAVYTINVPEGATGIVINGTGGQTDNITDFSVEGYWVDAARTTINEFGAVVYTPIPWGPPPTDPTDIPPSGSFKFSDSLGWGNIHVYAWDADGNALTAAYPGNEATWLETNDYGQAVYTINVPEGAAGVVVNGNGNQTGDITDFAPAGGGYWVDSSKTSINGFGTTVYDPIPWG